VTLAATIDAGGSGVKVGVVCTETWQTLADIRCEYAPASRAPGLLEWDPADWWRSVVRALADAVSAAGRPASHYRGLVCTCMRIPFVLVDEQCEPVAPGVLVPDRRGAAYAASLRSQIGSDELYRTTGHWGAFHFGLPKLVWYLRETPELWKRTRWVLQMHDWLLLRLCGAIASEPSSASMSQLLDVSTRQWAKGVLDAAGIDRERLPPLLDAGVVAGGLEGPLASAVGLLAGTPVHVGGGDTHVAALGAGAVEQGSTVAVAGTTTPLQLTTQVPLLDLHVRPLVSAHLRPGVFAAETNVSTSGGMLRWLRGITGLDYATLEARAAESPLGARDAMVTASNPEWGEGPWSQAPPISLVGLTPTHTVGDLARATYESMTYAIAVDLERLDSLATTPALPVIMAGGGSRSSLAAQMLADVSGRTVLVPELANATAMGGAQLIAGAPPPGDAAPELQGYEPDDARHAAYQPYVRRYVETFARLRRAFADETFEPGDESA
jgi:sugar (pentulose or hexulose) kinase